MKSIMKTCSSCGGKAFNPSVFCTKFIPGQNLVLVGAEDEYAAKCFNYASGEIVEKFSKVKESCYTLDVSEDASMCCFGDKNG